LIVLVRHGQTEWSRDGRHTSYTDLALTDEGRRQAERVGAALAGRDFAAVFSSPRRRAVETAALAGFPATIIDEDLAEWDYGDYEGLTSAEINERRPGWSLWRDGCPGGEDGDAVARRVDRVIERCGDADALLFAHGHVLRVLGARWVGLDASWGHALLLDTATIGTLGHEHDEPVIAAWNVTP
jgi:broad specificity phosphatase PhoE